MDELIEGWHGPRLRGHGLAKLAGGEAFAWPDSRKRCRLAGVAQDNERPVTSLWVNVGHRSNHQGVTFALKLGSENTIPYVATRRFRLVIGCLGIAVNKWLSTLVSAVKWGYNAWESVEGNELCQPRVWGCVSLSTPGVLQNATL